MAPTISETGVTLVQDNPNDPTQIREIAAPRHLKADALIRQQTEAERLRNEREVYTVGIRDLPGRGSVRKIKRPCHRCGALDYYYVAEDHSWVGDVSLCDSCLFMDVLNGDDAIELTSPHQLMSAELQRFQVQWPHISRTLGPMLDQALGSPDPNADFLGTRTKVRNSPFNRHWLELMARHASGDWGEFGTMAGTVVDDNARFAPGLCDVRTRNALAIEAGRGLVRSRFEVPVSVHPDLPDSCFRGQRWVNPRADLPVHLEGATCVVKLDIATVIGQRTHCRPGHAGEQCFGAV